MSYLSPEEEVIVISTQKPMRRWLQILLKSLAVLAALAAVIAAVIGWRYYAVHRQLERDLAEVVRQEEYVRALGGINAAPDMLDPRAPDSWRFRYLSSVRARRGLSEPEVVVESVDYDGANARVHLLVDGVAQVRHYRLYAGRDWRRAPLEARGWGLQQRTTLTSGVEMVFWDKDEVFARNLMADLPGLMEAMQRMGLDFPTQRIAIVPQEFDDLVHRARVGMALIVNSPHVDFIAAARDLSPQQQLRLALAQQVIREARDQSPITSELPAAQRLQLAMDDVLAWHWAVGDVSRARLTVWADKMKGQWVSPITGLPPTVVAELPPDAPDIAARLMMVWLLRESGPDALFALHHALTASDSWDEAYEVVAGLQAEQLEGAARALMMQPDAGQPSPPKASHAPAPTSLTLLTTTPDAHGRVLAQTAQGEVLLLQASADAGLTLMDGSVLDFDCVASGSQVQVQGRWLEQNRRLVFESLVLLQGVLPPILQVSAMDVDADMLVWRHEQSINGLNSNVSLVQRWADGHEMVLATPRKAMAGNLPPTFSRAGQPPLILWTQSVRCNRDWLVAYDPNLGTTGAWLLPPDHTEIIDAWYVPATQGFRMRLQTSPDAIYRTADHHVLQRVAEVPADDDAIPMVGSVLDPRTHRSLQVAQTTWNPVPAYGLANTQLVFVAADASSQGALSQVAQIDTGESPVIHELFTFSSRGSMTSLALCSDGSFLYGLNIAKSAHQQGVLRLRKPSGEDVAVSELRDFLYSPLFCR